MKYFKDKYLLILLVLVVVSSCTTTEVIAENEVNNSNDGTSLKTTIIDGKVTSNRTKIESAIKNAWNIHCDFPNQKLVISTTPSEYEKYKSSNIELSNALAQNDIAAKEHASELLETNAISPITDLPPGYVHGFKNTSMFSYKFDYTFSATEGEVIRYHAFNISSNADLTSQPMRRSTFRKSDGAETETAASVNVDFSVITTLSSSYKDLRIIMHNEANTSNLTKTFFKGKNYTGDFLTISIVPDGYVDLYYILSVYGGGSRYYSYK